MKSKLSIYLLFTVLLMSCSSHRSIITKVHLTNQKGFTQTINSKERLKSYEDDSFMLHQPHQKIVRVYQGNEQENKIIITTYHPNGRIYQSLECRGNRAFGPYIEWHENGKVKIKSKVIGGIPDINLSAQNSWIFDGPSYAYDEQDHLEALFNYKGGLLQNEAILYYPNGDVKTRIPYIDNKIHGTVQKYKEDGFCFEKTTYSNGELDGISRTYWCENVLATEEKYANSLLLSGLYFNPVGKLITSITHGNGEKAFLNKDHSYQLYQYQNGIPKGSVKLFDSKGRLINSYFQEEGIKHGEEITYYSETEKPKLLISWVNGKVHGTIKSWYENSQIEAQREMSRNKLQGISTAWYPDGNVMLIEDYDDGRLVKAKYFKIGERSPVSMIIAGKGLATLFDEKGILIRKVEYRGGKPVE